MPAATLRQALVVPKRCTVRSLPRIQQPRSEQNGKSHVVKIHEVLPFRVAGTRGLGCLGTKSSLQKASRRLQRRPPLEGGQGLFSRAVRDHAGLTPESQCEGTRWKRGNMRVIAKVGEEHSHFFPRNYHPLPADEVD